jgi:hypothetical protein
VRTDAGPTICLAIALVVGIIAGAQGRSGGAWGALAGAVFFSLWNILPLPLSSGGGPVAAFAALTLIVYGGLQGLIWGGLWGAVGAWFTRKKRKVDKSTS